MDEQGRGYTTEFVRDRHYRLHEKATPLLIHKIIPAHGMSWLGSDRMIFTRWLANISGDQENASTLGDIITLADSQSVAANLGAEGNRMATVKTIPLHEKMLTALRYLLREGDLPLNRNGAAGWITGNDCWLVSKRTVDAIRNQLTQEGHSGIPTKNGRLFDILQEHNILIPCGDKAIWTATIKGEGWHNELTLIKIPVVKIWTQPERRPDPFEGHIIPSEIKTTETEKSAQIQTKPVTSTNESNSALISKITGLNASETHIQKQIEAEKGTQNLTKPSAHQKTQQSLQEDTSALLSFLPSSPQEDDHRSTITAEDQNNDQIGADLSQSQSVIPAIKKSNQQSNQSEHTSPAAKSIGEKLDPVDPVDDFFDWLQSGIQTGAIKTNQPKARVHVVKEGVALLTPGIFQDYAHAHEQDLSKWTDVQKKVIKKNWHVKDTKGLNVIQYRVTGATKSTQVNVILFKKVSLVFGSTEPPKSNPHLHRED